MSGARLAATRVDRIACYARVSTEDQAERQTVNAQTDFLRRYCELHALPVAGIYVDDGISGTVPLEDRPEGRRLLDDADAGAFTTVLVYRLDRLGRSLKALLSAHERLDAAGVAIRSGTEPFDTASPMGKFLFSLIGGMAELEKATIGERMTGGRDRVARAGQYTGGPIPFGYDLDEHRRYIPSARIVDTLGITEAEVVRDVFSRIAYGGSSLSAERLRLTTLAVPCQKRYPKSKGRSKAKLSGPAPLRTEWALTTLAKMLHNALYKGAATVDSQHGTVERPGDGLVSAETWEAVQVALTRNRNLSKKNAKRDYLLRGLMRCGMCGKSYAGAAKHSGPTERLVYRCIGDGSASAVAGRRCAAGSISADLLEATVWDAVREYVEHPEEYIATAQRELRAQLADAGQNDAERRTLSRELAGKEQERERVLDLFRRGRITVAECDRDLDKIAVEAREIRTLVDAMRTRAEMATASEAYLSDVGAALAQMRGRLAEIEASQDRAEMRAVIELIVTRLVLHTELLGVVNVRMRKRVELEIGLAFQEERSIVSLTATPGDNYRPDPLQITRRLALVS